MHTGFWWGNLGKPRNLWEENIKMDLQEVKWVGMSWIVLALPRDSSQVLVHAVMNLLVP